MNITTMKCESGKLIIKTLENGVLNIKVKQLFNPVRGVTKYGLEKVV